MNDSLEQFLQSVERDSAYRVDCVLKESEFEITERVFFEGSNGAEQGPFIRKRILRPESSRLGNAYERLFKAQQNGQRFLHLPRIFDCRSTSEELTVVMELVPGTSLDQYGRLGLNEASRLFAKTCDAVTELHTQFNPPIIHRDIKPQNIMVTGSDVVLIDFGIARSLNSDASADTAHFGTRDYAPPEQYGFAQTDQRSDVYSLGLVLFYMVMGREPVAQERQSGLKASSLPPKMRNVVEKAVSFDPAARYASVQALKAAAMEAFEEVTQTRENIFAASAPISAEPSWSNPLPDDRSTARKVWGCVRNAIAIVVTLFMTLCVGIVSIAPEPNSTTANAPAWLAIIMYSTFFLIPTIAVCVLVSDETPLRRRIPLMAQVKGIREIRFWIILVTISLVVFALLSIFVLPLYTPAA